MCTCLVLLTLRTSCRCCLPVYMHGAAACMCTCLVLLLRRCNCAVHTLMLLLCSAPVWCSYTARLLVLLLGSAPSWCCCRAATCSVPIVYCALHLLRAASMPCTCFMVLHSGRIGVTGGVSGGFFFFFFFFMFLLLPRLVLSRSCSTLQLPWAVCPLGT